MTTPENRARYILDAYVRFASAQALTEPDVLKQLIAEAIAKAVAEDRDDLREKIQCDSQDPCAFQMVCSYHRAFAGAILGLGNEEMRRAAA